MRLRRCGLGLGAALGLLGLGGLPRASLSQKPLAGAAQKPGTSVSPKPVVAMAVLVAPVTAPATLPGMAKELQRALVAALKEASISAEPGRSDGEGALLAKLEELSAGRFRLTVTYRGASSHSVGDLEHLDDLIYAVVGELRPKLSAELPSVGSGRLATGPQPNSEQSKAPSPVPMPHSELARTVSSKREPSAAKPEPIPAKPEPSAAKREPHPDMLPPPVPVSLPAPTPVAPTPSVVASPEPKPRARPRVAVGVMGEPMSALPPGYYGLGVVGQQAIMGFLQQRLQVPAVATRLYSLVGGFEALEQSLRASARHTLMARLDAVSLISGVLSGRLHLVLLQDGKLLYDRSIALPPTVPGPAEPPATTFGRAVTAALETLSPELTTRLAPPS